MYIVSQSEWQNTFFFISMSVLSLHSLNQKCSEFFAVFLYPRKTKKDWKRILSVLHFCLHDKFNVYFYLFLNCDLELYSWFRWTTNGNQPAFQQLPLTSFVSTTLCFRFYLITLFYFLSNSWDENTCSCSDLFVSLRLFHYEFNVCLLRCFSHYNERIIEQERTHLYVWYSSGSCYAH